MEYDLNNLLKKVLVCLTKYLEKVLPTLSEDWWKQAVMVSLSIPQQQKVKQNNTSSLGLLDLAALLRVMDHNWFLISSKLNLPSEARHFLKEMITIRNRWAHATTEGFPVDDIYRDLDTLKRFAVLIEADETFLQEVQDKKKTLLTKEIQPSIEDNPINSLPSQENRKDTAEFEPGRIVTLKSNPTIQGAVVSVVPGKPENRYKIFVSGEIKTFYASQLEAKKIKDNSEIFTCERFHSYLTALQIRYPALSTLYSLNAARVEFIPYQFRPVLRFIKSDRPRLLIADGVGVGKTIEAGLILRELQARRDVRSVLIICPRPLITERKWEIEMRRFEEKFTHLNGKEFRYCIGEMDKEGVWPEQRQKIIVPYSLFDETLLYGSGHDGKQKGKRKTGLLDLDPPPRFDLVIVDEAHHIRNQNTFSHKAVRFFCDHAEAVVFLTATPIQLGNHDLFVLLNSLRPDLVIDQESFEHMAEPNPFINQAVSLVRSQEPEWTSRTLEFLDQAADTAWGKSILKNNPDFSRIRSVMTSGNVSDENRVQLIKELEAMYTFSGIINRTRRRDIGDFTVRKPETVKVSFSPSQQKFHDNLLAVQTGIFIRLHPNISEKFMMTTIRRQAASCLYGLAPFLEDILNRHIDELEWEDDDDFEDFSSGFTSGSIQSQIHSILEDAKSLDSHDPKLEALLNIIRDKQSLINNKVMLFSSFRHTLNYLYKNLNEENFRVGMIHGGTPDEERVELKNRFEKPREDEDSLDLLLFSEIGCEGLDYQFCDCIVNYDLPWNPMRIEQRIGRIDRNGQKSESVAIINMITPGTVDADIYERCLVRIGVFNNALGAGEEILGEIANEIKNIAENYMLTEDERRSKLQQLADNKIRLIQEQDELEQRQVELFGIRLPEDQMKKEIEDASSFWLSPASVQRLVSLYLQQKFGKEQEFILGEKPLKTLRLSQEARNSLLQDFVQIPRHNSSAYREWEKYLKDGNPHLMVTFDTQSAIKNPQAVFLMPLHPLVRQAALLFDTKSRVVTSQKIDSNDVPAGRYEFAIYQWRFHGVREDLVLQPIASSEALTTHLGRLLEKATDDEITGSANSDSHAWDELDVQHHKLWSEAREKHIQRTKELVEYRRESLTISHRARMALLNEQYNQTDNEKIRKMRQSQIATADSDYARRIQELDIAIERADVTAEAVGYGVIRIYREESYGK